MSDENDDLLAQAKAIQAQKMAQKDSGSDNDLLSQARSIQAQKLSQTLPQSQINDQLEQTSVKSNNHIGNKIADIISQGSSFPGTTSPIGYAAKFIGSKFDEARDQDEKDREDSALLNDTYKSHPWDNPGTKHDNEMAMGAAMGAANPAFESATSSILNSAKSLLPDSKDLAVNASKIAQEAMGMNSAKDLTSEFNPMTGKSVRGSDVIKGTGTTALDQGVLEGRPAKWYDNALNALQSSYQKLGPIFQSVQPQIDANAENIIQNVGPITTKTADVMQQIFDGVPTSSQRNLIVNKLGKQYSLYEQKLAAADGNLQALNDVKKELTTAAQNLSPQVYNSGTAKSEADLYKRLGGVVRQHIEDLANAAQDGAGDQIHQVNKTIGNLSSMMPSLQKGTRGGIPTNVKDAVQMVVGPVESAVAKGLNGASKIIQTPIGDITQKAIPSVSKTLINNPVKSPFSAQNTSPVESDAGHVTRILSNATNDSLKDVAMKFQQDPSLKACGDMLNKAVDNDDIDAKNRAIFCAAQLPKARSLIKPQG